MNNTYIHISITYYSAHLLEPEVHYYKNDGVNKISRWDMDVNTANKLMWELVKLGAKNKYTLHSYRNTICTREVSLFIRS